MKNFIRSSWVLGLALLSACSTSPAKKDSSVELRTQAWVELGPNSQNIARAITRDFSCPTIQLDSKEEPMDLRVGRSDRFPVRVCEKLIPRGTRSAQVGDQVLHFLQSVPKKILIIGDTGCRIKIGKDYTEVQSCNNAEDWPYLKIAQVAAEWNPDLVIHVGDYHYRESACPSSSKGCSGSPHGYDWPSWQADFFAPSLNLLKAAPWIFVRGNHESCSRAGEGWFRFLDPWPFSEECKDFTDPYWVQAGKVQLAVLDSSHADDRKAEDLDRYRSEFKKIQKFPLQSAWILTHKPIWTASVDPDPTKKKPLWTLNATLQEAAKGNLAQSVQLILSGHVHLFQLFQFADSGPSQLVLGNSGTHLSEEQGDSTGVKIGNRVIQTGISLRQFGFTTLEATNKDGWIAVARDREGKSIKQCVIQGSRIACGAEK